MMVGGARCANQTLALFARHRRHVNLIISLFNLVGLAVVVIIIILFCLLLLYY